MSTTGGIVLRPTAQNYMGVYDFNNQFMPEVNSKMVNLRGNGILGFIRTFGKIRPVSADKFYHAEKADLRKVERGVSLDAASGVFTCAEDTIQRANAMIIVSDPVTGKMQNGLVMSVDPANKKKFTAQPYDNSTWIVGSSGLNVITSGSHFKKGSDRMQGTIGNNPIIYSTSLVISKDNYTINDSDLCNISWLEAPDGNMYWHHNEIEDFYERFPETEELRMLTQVKSVESSPLYGEYQSTSGLFEIIRARGNSITGKTASMDDLHKIIKLMSKHSCPKSYASFLTTDSSLAIDTALATANHEKGTPGYGWFENKERAINYGFDAYRIGGYEFYKQTWNAIDDSNGLSPENIGAAGAIHGILMPMGKIKVQTGYDGNFSNKPMEDVDYLEIIHKQGAGINRRYQETLYGARFNNGTEDVTGISLLSESAPVLYGAKHWFIMEGE